MKNYFNYEKIKQSLKSPKVRFFSALSLAILIIYFIFWFIGLFITPSHYRPVNFIPDSQVSLYLSNYILPQMYNKSQLNEPFEIVFSQDGVNDILLRHLAPNSLKKSHFSDISITFKKARVLLTGKTMYRGFDFIVTLVLKPRIDGKGFFTAGISKIQAGTSTVPFAFQIAKRKILYELADSPGEPNIADYIGLLFSNNKIDPQLSFNHKKLRIQNITVQNEKLIVCFLPN